jgi:hypothetical protein
MTIAESATPPTAEHLLKLGDRVRSRLSDPDDLQRLALRIGEIAARRSTAYVVGASPEGDRLAGAAALAKPDPCTSRSPGRSETSPTAHSTTAHSPCIARVATVSNARSACVAGPVCVDRVEAGWAMPPEARTMQPGLHDLVRSRN